MKNSTAQKAMEALENLTPACIMVDMEGDLDSRIGSELIDNATSAIDAMRVDMAQQVELLKLLKDASDTLGGVDMQDIPINAAIRVICANAYISEAIAKAS